MEFSKIYIPRWLVFLFDICIVFFSIVLAYLLRFNFSIPQNDLYKLPEIILFVIFIRSISFVIGKTYSNIVRYTSSKDAIIIFIATTSGSLIFIIANLINYYFISEAFFIPFSIVIIDYIVTTFSLTAIRLFVKIAFIEINNPNRLKRNVVIYGAGESGLFTKRALDRDAGSKYKVTYFIDDDPKKYNKKIEGVTILSPDKFDECLKLNSIAHLILSIQNLSNDKKKEIIEICLNNNVKVLNVPPVSKWINGELSFKQIKKINIEDLLEREVIKLDEDLIKKDIIGKKVLVTGAAGSIGSELVRQISLYHPAQLILVDQAESPLYRLELEILNYRNFDNNIEIIIADISNELRMNQIFSTFNPNIVFHAAAYKHVPMMENNPSEALLVNVKGTKTLADLSVQYQVKKFVMISTDKAVNPTSIMGASKRIAEIYTQSLNQKNICRFITTRFGNVLGSNGSVIELFKKQIENGEALTITHPSVNRYFMTIPEACQLVLEAGTIGKGGEIFIFNMGKSVKIVDLAKKMIMLSGLTLGRDIQIKFTGLRPGEKLYEELLNDKENTLPTHHEQILIAKVREYDFNFVNEKVNDLIDSYTLLDNFNIVKKMKDFIPEFISQNSIYEQLDIVATNE